jgi:AcrR family transcriptional regulator
MSRSAATSERAIRRSPGDARPGKRPKPAPRAPARRLEGIIREFILDRSEELFIAHGYLKTTMDLIARESGLSKPTLYTHFKNKYELFTSLYGRLYRDLAEILDDLLGARADPRRVLEEFIDRYFRMMTANREFLRMYFRDLHLFLHENIEEQLTGQARSRKQLEERLAGVVRSRIRPAVRRRFGPRRIASSLFDLLEGAASDSVLHGHRNPAELKRFILELLDRGVLARRA